jgi:hypothetical protein
MKKLHVFAHRDRPLANLLRERLQEEGIACLVRNDELATALGELPFVECYPELWVVDDEAWPRARLLLDQWLTDAVESGPEWICPGCGERIEGQFQLCWNCNRERAG